MKLSVTLKVPTVSEYQELRGTTNWDPVEDGMVEEALQKSSFGVTIRDGAKIAGMGRVTGDESLYLYIQDVIVAPEYQGKGIGKMLMREIEKYIGKTAKKGAFIGLMAAKGVSGFYEPFGYSIRPEGRPGMFKTIK